MDHLPEIDARHQALVEQIPAVLYVNLADEDDTTVYVSPQTNEILGLSEQDWLGEGEDWVESVHPEDRERVIERYDEFLRSSDVGIDEYRFIRPDGREIWIHDRVRVIRDEDGEPILVQGVMFDVTEQKEAQAIIDQQVGFLKKVDAIGRRFTDLALRGADVGQILGALAEIAGNPVVLEDAAHQLVDYAVHAGSVERVLEAWGTHSRAGHAGSQDGAVTHQAGSPGCLWLPVRLRGEEWGRLHLLEMDGGFGSADELATDRAAAAVGLALYSERDAAGLAESAREALIADIVQGRFASVQELLARARGLGADFEGRTLAAMIVDLVDPPGDAERASASADPSRLRETVPAELRRAAADAGLTVLSAMIGDRGMALVAVPANDGERTLRALGAVVAERLAERLAGSRFSIGLSRTAAPDDLPRAITEAADAAAFGARPGEGSAVNHYDDLGIQHLLARLSEGPDLARFVESELKPLLDHDAARSSSLVPTLRMFLDLGGRKAEAARALHIDRRTLYLRLERIEKLLGRSLDDADARVRLEVALRGLEVLGRRLPVRRA